jgi:hypothetical protein
MQIDQISDGFCAKTNDADVEDAASARILVQNILKDIDLPNVFMQISRL